MANSYDINYDDERLSAVENERQDALNENEQLYSGMISDTDKYYQDQIQASKDWEDTQTKLQQENTDFAISQIEQQKEQAQKDYTKEQSGAYVDWQKQSNRYGANAEQLAAAGMSGTGYSESAQVSMYNTYQNRVSTARESYNQAVLNYNNSIKEAQLQNNSILAEIAYQSLQQQLELSLAGFQYKNQLILDQANRKTELDNIYYQRYQDVLDQINTENAMAESVRQYNENLALEKAQLEESKRQFDLELEEKKRQFDTQYSDFIQKIEKDDDDGDDDSGWMTRGEVGAYSDWYLQTMINRGELEESTINGEKMYRYTNSGNTIPASLITGKTQDKSQNADDILNSFFDSIFQSETGKNYKNTSGAALMPNPPKGNSGGDGIYTDETYASIRAISEKMTPAQLNYLVSVGYVEEYTVNGVTKFRIVDRKSGKSRENTPQNKKSLNSISVY